MLKKRQSKTAATGLYQRKIIANLPGIWQWILSFRSVLINYRQHTLQVFSECAVSGINSCLPQQGFENLVLYTDDLRSSPLHLTAAMSPVAMESN